VATCWRWVVETWNQVLSDIWLRVAVAAVVLALYAIRYVSRMEWHAPVGVYIAILGAMAAGVTLRKDPSPREKAVWIVLITVLMVAEIHTLVVDEKEHTAATKSISDALATTNSGLKETLSGLQGVTSKIGGISTDIKTGSDTGNSQFTTTLQGLQKAISSETGGNSFCYLMPSHLSNEGINLALISVGHYPLYNVGMRITDLHLMATLKNAFSSDVVSTNIGDIAPAGSARMLSISLPDGYPLDSGDHNR
jgi:hypothetical protein